jgi:uncharacterized secreted protein with C-terminal beta-propeller domain
VKTKDAKVGVKKKDAKVGVKAKAQKPAIYTEASRHQVKAVVGIKGVGNYGIFKIEGARVDMSRRKAAIWLVKRCKQLHIAVPDEVRALARS